MFVKLTVPKYVHMHRHGRLLGQYHTTQSFRSPTSTFSRHSVPQASGAIPTSERVSDLHKGFDGAVPARVIGRYRVLHQVLVKRVEVMREDGDDSASTIRKVAELVSATHARTFLDPRQIADRSRPTGQQIGHD